MRITYPNEQFGGLIPALDEKKLPPDGAQEAENVNLLGNTLEPVKDLTLEETLGSDDQNSLYRYRYGTNTMTGGTPGSLGTFQAVTDGAFVFNFRGRLYSISGLNFSADGSTAAVASRLQSAVRTAVGDSSISVTYSGGKYVFTTSNQSLNFLEAPVVGLLNYGTGTNIYTGSMNTPGNAFDGVTSASSLGSAWDPGAASVYLGKNYGASTKVTSAKAWSSTNAGYTSAANITLTFQGSDNGSTWVDLDETTIADALGISTTLTVADYAVEEYSYYRVVGSTATAPELFYFAEIQFFGEGGTGQTDIGTATYLNMLAGGTAVIVNNSSNGEWLTWPEENISVARTLVNEDTYQRIYWTGEDDKLKVKGTFGERNVGGITAPSAPNTITLTDLFDESSVSMTFEGTGSATFSVPCPVTNLEATDAGFNFTFDFPGYTTGSVASLPTAQFEIVIPGVSGAKTVSDVGTKYPQTDSGTTWAEIQMKIFSYNFTVTEPAPYPGSVNWSACTVTVNINMNYYLETIKNFYYLMTYVDDLGQESPPSAVSDLYIRNAQDKLVLSSLSVSGDGNVTHKNLYRSSTSNSTDGDAFRFVAQITNATTTYTDWIRDEDLVEAITIVEDPIDGLNGLVYMPGQFFAAFKGQTVHFSEPNLGFNWPAKYRLNIDTDIVWLAVSGNDLVVVTEERPYIISGDSPGFLRQTKLMINQSCVSARGVTDLGYRVIYPSPDGLVSIVNGQGQLITESLIQPNDWRNNYNADTALARSHDNKLYCHTSSHFLIFDFDEGIKALTTSDETIQGMYEDLKEDDLYVIQGAAINEWDSSTDNKLIKWKSKLHQLPRPWRPSCLEVIAKSYPTTNPIVVNIYATESQTLVESIEITGKTRKLPKYRREEIWSFEIESYVEIDRFTLAASIGELQNA
jgi:hypothetical protein